jgi:hypothetical protein
MPFKQSLLEAIVIVRNFSVLQHNAEWQNTYQQNAEQ